MCDFIKLMPREIVLIIFDLLRSKDRSLVCSVSKLFKRLSISSSKSLSSFPKLFSSRSPKKSKITKHNLHTIVMQGDYHLIVRLNYGNFIDIICFQMRKICELGHLDIVNLYIEHGGEIVDETDWDEGLKGACIGDHLEIAKIMIEKGQKYWLDSGFKSACKYGRSKIVNVVLSSYQLCNRILGDGMFYACSRNHSDVTKLIALEILRCKDIEQTGRFNFCAHCGKSVAEHI